MSTSVHGFTATTLRDGRVLLVGGVIATYPNVTNGAEIFDPDTRTFSPTGNMTVGRWRHTATLLQDGRVLIVGGYSPYSGGWHATAEIYDPRTGQFTSTGSMAVPRETHTATLLTNGQVLITGGLFSATGTLHYLSSAELYDPATGQFTSTGSMMITRLMHAATLLDDGRVLITGGFGNTAGNFNPTLAEVYDPAAGTFAATGNMTMSRVNHTATLLDNGKVLIVGGCNGAVVATAELYDPKAGTFSATAAIFTPYGPIWHTATLLKHGHVLVTGGYVAASTQGIEMTAAAQLYDPTTETWSSTASMTTSRAGHAAALLKSGQVLIVGGGAETGPETAELYKAGPARKSK